MALGCSIAIISAAYMLLLGILGNVGLALNSVSMMQSMHIFFSLSIWGIIAGIIEGAVHGFIVGYLIAYIYNLFVK